MKIVGTYGSYLLEGEKKFLRDIKKYEWEQTKLRAEIKQRELNFEPQVNVYIKGKICYNSDCIKFYKLYKL